MARRKDKTPDALDDFDPRAHCKCGALAYPGGWCFKCGRYQPNNKPEEWPEDNHGYSEFTIYDDE